MFWLVLFLALPIFSQETAPFWLSEERRSSEYPNSEWHIGFAKNNINGEPSSADFPRTEKDALSNLSEKIFIQTQVRTDVQTNIVQEMRDMEETEFIRTVLNKIIKTSSDASLVKIISPPSYYDKKTGCIYAFAAVRISDLANFYKGSINLILDNAEKELKLAGQLSEIGKKKTALKKVESIENTLDSTRYWEILLNRVEPEGNNAFKGRKLDISLKINDLKIAFENGTYYYLDTKGNDYLAKKIQSLLYEENCNCAIGEASEADYRITIEIENSRCNQDENNQVFCFVNTVFYIENIKIKKLQKMKFPEVKGRYTSGNKDLAMRDAYDRLAKDISTTFLKELEK